MGVVLCVPHLAGILCGDCAEGSGFSVLLNRCKSCDGAQTMLVLVLVLADVAVIVFALLLMLPLPAFLYPTLFYLQLVPHLTEHFPVTFETLSPYLAYVGSALGLYFPYDFCLHPNMPALGSYTLRYIPILLLLLLTPLLLYVRAKKLRPRHWHGLWWLLLLLYTPTVHTSVSLLDCPALEGEEPFTPRWYINGNVRCFQGGHAPLGLLALLVLGCCVALIPLSVLLALGKLRKPYGMHHLTTPLTDPYRERYRWWCGVELGKRLLLVLFSVAFKKNDYAVIYTLVAVMVFSGFVKPYRSKLVNLLDALYSVDVFLLLCLRNTVGVEESLQVIPTQSGGRQECEEVEGHTPFAILLAPFYYLPLLVGVVASAAWGVWYLYGFVRSDVMPMLEQRNAGGRSASIVSESDNVPPQRARTQTVLEMSECETSSPKAARSERKFSFKIQQPRIRRLSRKKNKVDKTQSAPVWGQKETESISLQRLDESDNLGKTEVTVEVREEGEEEKEEGHKSPLIVSTSFVQEDDSYTEI